MQSIMSKTPHYEFITIRRVPKLYEWWPSTAIQYCLLVNSHPVVTVTWGRELIVEQTVLDPLPFKILIAFSFNSLAGDRPLIMCYFSIYELTFLAVLVEDNLI